MAEIDKYTQAGQSISKGLGDWADLAQKQAVLKQDTVKAQLSAGQKIWENLQQDRDTTLKLLPTVTDPNMIKYLGNNLAALDAQLQPNPELRYKPIDTVDEVVINAYKAKGELDKAVEKGLIKPEEADSIHRKFMAEVYKAGGEKKVEFVQTILEKAKAEATATKQVEETRQGALEKATTVINTAKEAMGKTNFLSAGAVGKWTKFIGGLPSNNLAALLDTVSSTKTVNLIKEMKEQSKTGATGFGQLNERELDLLLADIATLKQDQSPEQLEQQLMKVITNFEAVTTKLNAGQQTQSNAGPAVGTVEGGYTFKGGNPADPNNWVKN